MNYDIQTLKNLVLESDKVWLPNEIINKNKRVLMQSSALFQITLNGCQYAIDCVNKNGKLKMFCIKSIFGGVT